MKDSVTKWSEYAANTVMYNKYLSYGIISDQDFISPIPPWKSFGSRIFPIRWPMFIPQVYTLSYFSLHWT